MSFLNKATPKAMKEIKLSVDDFITLYQEGKCELIDVRMDFEREIWGLNFGLKIAPNELEAKLNELPKDKIIVLACPNKDRSIIVRDYLDSKGFNAKYLDGGLLKLMETLKGGRAKEFKIN